MVLSVNYSVLRSVEITIVYDDETVKKLEIGKNDIVKIAYNKDGMRREIKGRVAEIETCPFERPRVHTYIPRHGGCHEHERFEHEHCWIVVDGSSTYDCKGMVEKIDVHNIIDAEIIVKYNTSLEVVSPDNETRITHIRLIDNQFQISTDNGKNWIAVVDIPVQVEEDSDEV